MSYDLESNAFGILRKISLNVTRFLCEAFSFADYYIESRKNMFQRFFAKKPVLTPTVDPIASFIITRHRKLLQTFRDNGEEKGGNHNFSSNIDPIFYNKKELNQIMLIENNHLEKEWKTRIMIDSTPRGNLIMFYDVYKQGFAYYSDQNSIPYSVLNGSVMKYVVIFGCRDFYMDENFLPKGYSSPLSKIFLEDDKPAESGDNTESNKKTAPKKIDTKSGPFAKFKNYRFDDKKQMPPIFFNTVQQQHRSFFSLGTIALKNLFRWSIIGLRRAYYRMFIYSPVATLKQDVDKKDIVKKDVDKKPMKEKYVNKFINMGKIYNFSILQITPEDSWISVESTRFDGFFGETNSRSVGNNIPIPLPRPVSGMVVPRSSAVCKNPNLSMSWQQYKAKITEDGGII
jgi:hypothetical protein